MTQESLSIERIYNAPVELVWEALTRKDQMRKWYFDIEDFRLEEGAEFSFKGVDHEGKEWIHLCRIREIIPLKKFSHSWRYKDQPGDTLVTWEFFEEGNQTRVRLTQTGFETFPPLKSLAKENFEKGWTEILTSHLKDFVELETKANKGTVRNHDSK